MIGISFQGQLGNQMFQYAAARVQAERLGCSLIIGPNFRGRRASIMDAARLRPAHQIFDVFPHLRFGYGTHGLALLNGISHCLQRHALKSYFPHYFSPNTLPPEQNEPYDARIWKVTNNTWLSGYYQSPRYFAGFEDDIRHWFTPSVAVKAAIKEIHRHLPAPPLEMVAVHVRLGDYLSQRDGLAHPVTGWALPSAYYAKALSLFSPNAPIALFSDDTKAAGAMLPRCPSWTSKSSSAAVDLFLLASFPNVIIANSSFSWWGAWLNHQPNKIVAPKFHVGWRRRVWYPTDIKVDEWVYV